ncbi:hypothetical protein FRX31_005960 [Thalictrum thalictroides]|uniref:Uncharacterized protein n=1 Tax=Thalictrum thalictroides TaxID=46969 RepID=A0A7J6X510_THATH|nr:hypothetical protein FRX31_005960 [Thalictrum thalictroides]
MLSCLSLIYKKSIYRVSANPNDKAWTTLSRLFRVDTLSLDNFFFEIWIRYFLRGFDCKIFTSTLRNTLETDLSRKIVTHLTYSLFLKLPEKD